MLTALVCGTLGVISTLIVGTRVLDLSIEQALWACLVVNACGIFALLVTLKGERTAWSRRIFFGKSRKTWPVFLTLFFAPLISLVPALQTGRGFGWLILPLILCTGFCIVAFGPIQDRLVARAQRRERRRLSP